MTKPVANIQTKPGNWVIGIRGSAFGNRDVEPQLSIDRKTMPRMTIHCGRILAKPL
jgi:hypothetical protein